MLQQHNGRLYIFHSWNDFPDTSGKLITKPNKTKFSNNYFISKCATEMYYIISNMIYVAISILREVINESLDNSFWQSLEKLIWP